MQLKSGSARKNVICREQVTSSDRSLVVRDTSSSFPLASIPKHCASSLWTKAKRADDGKTKRSATEMLEKKLTASIHPPTGDATTHRDPAHTSAQPDHGSSVSKRELTEMHELLVESLSVVSKRGVVSKEARIWADPTVYIKKRVAPGLSQETVMAIRRQILGVGERLC